MIDSLKLGWLYYPRLILKKTHRQPGHIWLKRVMNWFLEQFKALEMDLLASVPVDSALGQQES